MGTTADKLNRLIKTKEGIRQEINRAYRTEEISTSDTFNNYIQKLMEHPFYLNGIIEGNIESVKLYNVTSIGTYAFYGCTSLTEASFPNATSIEKSAFTGCNTLTTIDLSSVSSIARPSANKNSGVLHDGVFYNCHSLASLNLPGITSLRGGYIKPLFEEERGYSVFNGSSLMSLSLPNVTSLEYYALCDCSTLTNLYIGTETSSVCTLDVGVFQYCRNLTNIYVPASLVDSYKSATNWSSYANKIKAAP